jgi:hypothetical protein
VTDRERFQDGLDRMMARTVGDGPVQKLVILNKLDGLAKQTLRLTKDRITAGSPEQQWNLGSESADASTRCQALCSR